VKATCGIRTFCPRTGISSRDARRLDGVYSSWRTRGQTGTILLSSAPGISIIQGITGSAPTPAGMETRIGGRIDTLDVRYEPMTWTKPEFEIVAVTLEVTAYAATR